MTVFSVCDCLKIDSASRRAVAMYPSLGWLRAEALNGSRSRGQRRQAARAIVTTVDNLVAPEGWLSDRLDLLA